MMRWTMNRKRRLSCLVAGIVLASAGCMTPGYQYLDPPGFSSTYFQVTQGAAMRTVRPRAMARVAFELRDGDRRRVVRLQDGIIDPLSAQPKGDVFARPFGQVQVLGLGVVRDATQRLRARNDETFRRRRLQILPQVPLREL